MQGTIAIYFSSGISGDFTQPIFVTILTGSKQNTDTKQAYIYHPIMQSGKNLRQLSMITNDKLGEMHWPAVISRGDSKP